MKKGTIIRNHWAGSDNPTRYCIYLGCNGRYVNVLELVNGKLKKGQYYKSTFQDKEKFEIVGQSKGFDVLKDDLKSFLEGEGNA
ncbi:hypothetical protein GLV94_03075 [Virgibacillus halodenitrificans]|uniref:hypothetical protein n=1 Tax=Virgibacillus halodenitrificans TaxID=1482 RepID=UPI00136D19E8|nr:hypothetical protein [Virgibacillus halodenitrificans]MYL44616.1 hypothetical protein [Virgibacillus halodenitrificans]